VREAHRLAESKDPYLATVAMGRQGILEYLGTLPECREKLLSEPRARLRCKGSFDCDLTSASRKASLRSGWQAHEDDDSDDEW